MHDMNHSKRRKHFPYFSFLFAFDCAQPRLMCSMEHFWCIDMALEVPFHCFELAKRLMMILMNWTWCDSSHFPSIKLLFVCSLLIFFAFLFDSTRHSTRLIYYEPKEVLIDRRPQRQPPLDSCPPRLTVIEAFGEMTDDSARKLSFVTEWLAGWLSELKVVASFD